MTTATFQLMLRIPDAAERLGIRSSTVRDWVWKRKIAHVRVGKRMIRIPASEVDRILAAGFVPARTCKRRSPATVEAV